MDGQALARGAWAGARSDFTGRLGRAVRDGLLGLGLLYLMNDVVLSQSPPGAFASLGHGLGVDPEEHAEALRLLALGALLDGADHAAALVALLSLAMRTAWRAGTGGWAAHTEGRADHAR